MKKLFFFAGLACILASCTNENSMSPQEPKHSGIRVAHMGDFPRIGQRFGDGNYGGGDYEDTTTVLWFENQEVYDDAYQNILAMTPEERLDYFAELGFEGAYCKWQLADEMMEELFDNEDLDSISFVNEYNNLKASLKDNLVCFDETNPYDATPYLTFTDEEAALLGNKMGYVAIGDKLISPAMLIPSYEFPPNSYDFIDYSGAKVQVTNKTGGKTFHSSLQIGRFGQLIAYKAATWRTKFLFIKDYYFATNYQGLIRITNTYGKQANIAFNHNGRNSGDGLPKNTFLTEVPASLFPGSATIEIINFRNSKGSAKASKKILVVMK